MLLQTGHPAGGFESATFHCTTIHLYNPCVMVTGPAIVLWPTGLGFAAPTRRALDMAHPHAQPHRLPQGLRVHVRHGDRPQITQQRAKTATVR